jgi:hypothetical protein
LGIERQKWHLLKKLGLPGRAGNVGNAKQKNRLALANMIGVTFRQTTGVTFSRAGVPNAAQRDLAMRERGLWYSREVVEKPKHLSIVREAMSKNGTPINKSQAIRAYLAGSPKAKPREVVVALGEKGIKVAPTLVYQVKSKARKARRRAKRDRAVESSRQTVAEPVGLIQKVQQLGREVGGIVNLIKLVEVLSE